MSFDGQQNPALPIRTSVHDVFERIAFHHFGETAHHNCESAQNLSTKRLSALRMTRFDISWHARFEFIAAISV